MSALTQNERTKLRKDLRADEGFRSTVYKCPMGKWTIGIGRNVEDRGITEREAEFLFHNDVDLAETDAMELASLKGVDWHTLPSVAKVALCNMVFQLGRKGASGFNRMWAALAAGNGALAAHEAMDSRWAEQTEDRAKACAFALEGVGSDA